MTSQPVSNPSTPVSKRRAAIVLLLAIAVMALAIVRFYQMDEESDVPSPEAHATLGIERAMEIASRQMQQKAESARREADRQAEVNQKKAEVTRIARAETRQRWTTLPKWIRSVHFSSSGDAYFEAESIEEQESLEISSARLMRGESAVIKGNILLIDSKNRFWVSDSRNPLACRDGERWITSPFAEKREGSNNFRYRIIQRGWEDSAGAVWFIMTDQDRKVVAQRMDRHGQWKEFEFRQEKYDVFGNVDMQVVEGPRGILNVVDDETVYRLNGEHFEAITPRTCLDDDTLDIVVLADGSIATICRDGRFWFYDPPTEQQVMDWLLQLESPDAGERDAAARELTYLPEDRKPAIEANRHLAASPEAQARLKDVIAAYADGGSRDDWSDPEEITYSKGHVFGPVNLVHNSIDGSAVLGVWDYRNANTGERYEQALLTIGTDGTWTVRPMPAVWVDGRLSRTVPIQFDDRGRPWQVNERTISSGDVNLTLPTSFSFYQILGTDRFGRICLSSNNRIVIVDESAEPSPPVLPRQEYRARGRISVATDGTPWGWIERDGSFDTLCRYQDGQWQPVDGAPRGRGQELIPLRDGGMIVLLSRGDNRAGLFDHSGKWHIAFDLKTLIESNFELLLKLSPEYFPSGRVFPAGRFSGVVSDVRAGGIWLKYKDTFRFYSGKTWIDVLEQSKKLKLEGDPLRLAIGTAGASGIVTSDLNGRNLYRVSIVNERAQVTPLTNNEENRGGRTVKYVHTERGEIYFPSAGKASPLLHVTGNQVTTTELNGEPILVDPTGSLWLNASGWLNMVHGNDEPLAPVQSTSIDGPVVCGPDGQLWMITPVELIGIRYSEADGEVVQTGQWPWPSPQTNIDRAFVDSEQGLWLIDQDGGISRTELPGNTAEAQR